MLTYLGMYLVVLGIFLGKSLTKLNYTKFNKKITWIYQRYQKKKHMHTQKYMKYYNFFVLIKRKMKKNIIIKDKVKMERERERETDDICYKCKPN